MKSLARILLPVLALAALTGCGNGSESTDSSAATTACRSYVLVGGADDQILAKELTAVTSGNGSYNRENATARLTSIRAAAAKAGLTDGLPVKEYRLFRGIVETALALQAEISPASDGAMLDTPAAANFTAAVDAVHKRCD